MAQAKQLTPLMQQYHDIKAQYSETLLFFQVGDFYEFFFEDAKQAAAFLGITLTARGKNNGEPIPLCGVPVHALDHYLHKLVKGGFKVAICNQLEEPKPGGVVKRGVTQVLTPGTLTDAKLLDDKSASYLFSFFPAHDSCALLFGELLTAQIFATVIPASSEKILESELIRFFPDEILMPHNKIGKQYQSFFKRLGYYTTLVDIPADEQVASITEWINNQFTEKITRIIERHESLRLALYYFYAYMRKNKVGALDQFHTISFYKPSDFLILDAATQRNLELVKNNSGGQKHTLFAILDGAKTAMGSRMIKKWILRPLVKKDAIVQRQEVIALLINDMTLMYKLEDILASIGDIERVIGRIALSRAPVHDYLSLMSALSVIPQLRILLHEQAGVVLLRIICRHIADFSSLQDTLESALNDDLHKEWIIKSGYDERLDRLRDLVNNSNNSVVQLEQFEQKKTGIQSLKIRYNHVHGFYIEVTKANFSLVPQNYRRIQTLVGRERFTMEALQDLQREIEEAKYQIDAVEKELFEGIKATVLSHISQLRKLSHALAHCDALLGFARVASDNGYARPSLNKEHTIVIEQGRHPVVEQTLEGRFVPNNTVLNDAQFLWIITGPNMGGKSTYLRQVAHICIMAHLGSFVPAKKADIAILDRVFTRIGAGDNLAEGKSTFLVEMEETASICTQATKNSLVILDEVGRGTSTFDGLAIAQAVVEYLFHHVQARCLFATHYHELTQLQTICPGMISVYAASKKTKDGIVFLYHMVQGVADGSFGIEVAKLAQLPSSVIKRAQELVTDFSKGSFAVVSKPVLSSVEGDKFKQIIEENTYLKAKLAQLRDLDYDNLSPKQALDLLWQLKETSL